MAQETDPQRVAAITDFFMQIEEAVRADGRHAGHELEQAGRCVYCSCGFRVGQAKLSELRKAVLEHDG